MPSPEQSLLPPPTNEDFFSNSKSNDLQSNFQKFRAQKLQEAKDARLKKNSSSSTATKPPRSAAEKAILRQKWVDRLKFYLDVPYHRRYADETTEQGRADLEKGLFLDCCGILRQVSADLEQEMGWKLGRGNQAYQYALMAGIKSGGGSELGKSKYKRGCVAELEAGDIIFYEADYLDTRKKPQAWDMTHVEIYLGPGDKSLGSRWKQRVAIHDSYALGTDQQPSMLWKVKPNAGNSDGFHFFSLDAWLDHTGPLPPEWNLDDPVGAEASERFAHYGKGLMAADGSKKSIFCVDAEEE